MTSPLSGKPYLHGANRTQHMDKGKGKEKEKVRAIIDKINDHYDPFIDDVMVIPDRRFAYNPHFEDGWVSDEEGHPELGRISPCTFARWSTGCVPVTPAKPTKLQKPVIPCRSSSLRRAEPKQHTKASQPHFNLNLPDTNMWQVPPVSLDETPLTPAPSAIEGFDAVQAIKDIGALRKSLMKLVNEKQVLWDEIDALRTERAHLEEMLWKF